MEDFVLNKGIFNYIKNLQTIFGEPLVTLTRKQLVALSMKNIGNAWII